MMRSLHPFLFGVEGAASVGAGTEEDEEELKETPLMFDFLFDILFGLVWLDFWIGKL